MKTAISLVIFLLLTKNTSWYKMDVSSSSNNDKIVFNNKFSMIEKDNSASKESRQLTGDTGILGAKSDILIATV